MGRVVLGPRKIYQNCCKGTCDLILAHGGSLAQPYAGCEICGNLNIIQTYMVYTSSRLLPVHDYQARSSQLWFKWRSRMWGSFTQFSGWEACSSDHYPLWRCTHYAYFTISSPTAVSESFLSFVAYLLLLHYWVPSTFVLLSGCLCFISLPGNESCRPACRALNPRRKTKTTVEAFQIWPVQGPSKVKT